MLSGPIDPETVISKNPSPSADGTNFEGFLFVVVFVVVGLFVDGDEVNQLKVVIGKSVVVVVVVVVGVVVTKASSMNDDRSRTFSASSIPRF